MRKLSLITIVVSLALSCGTAAAAGGSLTSTEYYQLTAAQSRLKAIRGVASSAKALHAALWACEQIEMSTPLLTEERASCDDLAQFGLDGQAINTVVVRCDANPVLAERLSCLVPSYQRMLDAIKGLYRADSVTVQIAAARGFTGSCAQVLGTPPKALSAEGRMVSDLTGMVSALRSRNMTALRKFAARLVTAGAQQEASQILSGGSDSLTVCPHQ